MAAGTGAGAEACGVKPGGAWPGIVVGGVQESVGIQIAVRTRSSVHGGGCDQGSIRGCTGAGGCGGG